MLLLLVVVSSLPTLIIGGYAGIGRFVETCEFGEQIQNAVRSKIADALKQKVVVNSELTLTLTFAMRKNAAVRYLACDKETNELKEFMVEPPFEASIDMELANCDSKLTEILRKMHPRNKAVHPMRFYVDQLYLKLTDDGGLSWKSVGSGLEDPGDIKSCSKDKDFVEKQLSSSKMVDRLMELLQRSSWNGLAKAFKTTTAPTAKQRSTADTLIIVLSTTGPLVSSENSQFDMELKATIKREAFKVVYGQNPNFFKVYAKKDLTLLAHVKNTVIVCGNNKSPEERTEVTITFWPNIVVRDAGKAAPAIAIDVSFGGLTFVPQTKCCNCFKKIDAQTRDALESDIRARLRSLVAAQIHAA